MEDLTGVDVTPESKVAHGPKDSRKGRNPAKKDRDEIIQGRIWIRSRRLPDTGSPPKMSNAGYEPRLGDDRVCHT
jgi:hypothetical protein